MCEYFIQFMKKQIKAKVFWGYMILKSLHTFFIYLSIFKILHLFIVIQLLNWSCSPCNELLPLSQFLLEVYGLIQVFLLLLCRFSSWTLKIFSEVIVYRFPLCDIWNSLLYLILFSIYYREENSTSISWNCTCSHHSSIFHVLF